MEYRCPECGEELDYLDMIVRRMKLSEDKIAYDLYICHNEDCREFGSIFNDKKGYITRGDPSGLY